jgi:fucose 4-O-acetylase-like acetyltransferase
MTIPHATLESRRSRPAIAEAASIHMPRLAYIDNLRTVLIMGVLMGHLSVTYGLPADWYYKEGGETSPLVSALGLVLLVIGLGFAMGLFFILAGYFTPPAYDRKGGVNFLLNRFKRLGIPLLFFEIAINPLVHYLVDIHGGDCTGSLYDCQFQGTFWQYLRDYPPLMEYSLGDGPVWTLMALLIFSVFYALWHVVDKKPAEQKAVKPVPGNGVIALFALIIGLSTFLVRIWTKVLVFYEPLHLEFAHFPQYIALFIAGAWAYRGDWLTLFTNHQVRLWRWVAFVCILVLPAMLVWFGALSGTVDERVTGGVNIFSLVYSLWEGFLCVSMVITILAWFRQSFNHQGRLAQVLSESTFAVYVLHPAIIVPFALLLSDIRLQLNFKFLVVSPVAIALCYFIVYVLRKVPYIKAVVG